LTDPQGFPLVRFCFRLLSTLANDMYVGQTSAIASISGPIEVRAQAELPSMATFEVNVRPLAGVPGTSSRALAAAIRAALFPSLLLSRHPRTLIQLVVQALSPLESPGLAAAAINAATCALLAAGSIPMSGVLAAVVIGRTAHKTLDLVLDPPDDTNLTGEACFAFIFGGGGIGDECRLAWTSSSITSQSTAWTTEEIDQATTLAREGAATVRSAMKASLVPAGNSLAHVAATNSQGHIHSKPAGRESDDGEGTIGEEIEEIDDDTMEI
jgi:exosome complex component RRP46